MLRRLDRTSGLWWFRVGFMVVVVVVVMVVGLFMMMIVMLVVRVVILVVTMLLRRGLGVVGVMRLLGRLRIDMRRGWWWLIMLTVKVAGFIVGWFANWDDISDGGLVFALYEILHDLGGSLLWLSGRNLY
jgi:hypothetical protein